MLASLVDLVRIGFGTNCCNNFIGQDVRTIFQYFVHDLKAFVRATAPDSPIHHRSNTLLLFAQIFVYDAIGDCGSYSLLDALSSHRKQIINAFLKCEPRRKISRDEESGKVSI